MLNRTEKTLTKHLLISLTDLWWLYVIAAAGSAALLITVVALIRRKRNKGESTTYQTFHQQNVLLNMNFHLIYNSLLCLFREQITEGRKHGEFSI